ncbi:hypothetical protein MTP09_12195 [Chryseobacterium suipulveris]|uniref:Lipoprotein n=1 Tax=Chryseobacterium suipulveris TaxID=2929800 RepID=A0ABY4BS47_9FLAO|nr:hypothetical protein [Chryseobacterium suipulveris]UOE40651.1 hypothetical protein MTP09_12195 [Chryseobacterium suipulveris]
MKKLFFNTVYLLIVALLSIACQNIDRSSEAISSLDPIGKAEGVNRSSKEASAYLLINEANKCGGGIGLTNVPNSTVPYYPHGNVYFWNDDSSLYYCRGCTDLPRLLVNYIENYYNNSAIDYKFLPNDPNYVDPDYDFSIIKSNGYLELDIFQTVDASLPPSYWVFPIGSGLPPDLLNRILQQVVKHIQDNGGNMRVYAVQMYYDSLLCNMGEYRTNGLTLRIKFI